MLLLEEGYAAVTSRRVGAKAGLEAAARALLLPHHGRPLRGRIPTPPGDRPVEGGSSPLTDDCRRLWQLNGDLRGPRFNIGSPRFADHRKAIRTEIARYAERFRPPSWRR